MRVLKTRRKLASMIRQFSKIKNFIIAHASEPKLSALPCVAWIGERTPPEQKGRKWK
jgi:hypothetical protein